MNLVREWSTDISSENSEGRGRKRGHELPHSHYYTFSNRIYKYHQKQKRKGEEGRRVGRGGSDRERMKGGGVDTRGRLRGEYRGLGMST